MTAKAIVGILLFLLSSAANAVLVSLDEFGGKIVQQDASFYWLADAKFASTEQFGVTGISSDGLMTYSKAEEWVLAMNTHNYLGQSDWRIPTIPELLSIWDELEFFADPLNPKQALFTNLSGRFWSSTDSGTGGKWIYDSILGIQDFNTIRESTWVVRNGELSPIPVPAAFWLFGTALIGLVGFSKRSKAA